MNFRGEQVRLLYGAMPFTIVGASALVALVAVVLWPVVESESVITWLICMLLVLSIRFLLWASWRRRHSETAEQEIWLNRFRQTITLTGLSWMLGTLLVFPSGQVVHQAFFVLASASMVAGATNTLSPDRLSAALFIVPTLAPVLVRLMLETDKTSHAMAIVLGMFVPFAISTIEQSQKRLADNFRLRSEALEQARELRESARHLSESESQLSGISANLPGIAFYRIAFSPIGDMQCTYVSPNVEEVLGLPAEAFQRNVEIILDYLEPDAANALKNAMDEYLATGGVSLIELPMRDPRGVRKWIRLQSHLALRGPDGTQIRDGIVMDITAAKEAETQMEAHRQRLDLALDAANTCTWDSDFEANLITLDSRWAVMLGDEPRPTRTTPRALVQTSHPEDRPAIFAATARMNVRGNEDYRVEQRVRTVNGEWLWIGSRGRVISRQPNGRPLRVIGINTDISAHKAAEETLERRIEERATALAESERRHRTLLGNLQGMAYRCLPDEKHTMQYVSEGCELLLGIKPAEFTSNEVLYADCIHTEDQDRVWKAIQSAIMTQSSCQIEYRVRHANGAWRWVWEQGRGISDSRGKTIAIEGYITDITDRIMLERQTNRAQRLESIGTLAGGIAHDINNALAPILAGVGLLTSDDPEDLEVLETIEQSARRGAEMVKRLLAFARGAEGEREAINPAALFDEIERIIRSTFPKNIDLSIAIEEGLGTVQADPTQLHQVLLNLCVNARDAMPIGGSLKLEAAAEYVDGKTQPGVHRQRASPGHYVVLRVSDTGTGIEPDIMDRIFDPFFSTKPPDKGSGLGLSSVLGIAESHGGFVEVVSQSGHGSMFSVYVPAHTEARAPTPSSAPVAHARGDGETILFVDDEPAVRTIVALVLERLNFIPLLAGSGAEGLDLIELHQQTLRAVVTDLNMPEMDGLTFVRELRKRHPHLPVIIASGYLESDAAAEFGELGISHALSKPFAPDALVDALRSVLHAESVSPDRAE